VTVLRSIAHAKGHALPASPLGKIKLIAQVVAILLLILWGTPRHFANQLGQIALWVATAAALVSAVDYSRRFNAILNGAPAPAAKLAVRSQKLDVKGRRQKAESSSF
jgi:CDP-diacylglycerol--glycerol-3-phosphate 3-phosphatidyltransferase